MSRHGLYDPEQDSVPLQRFAMVKPGAIRRAMWQGFAWGLGVSAALAVLAYSMPAFAQTQCDSRDRVLALLADDYGENRHALGIAGEGSLMELFASDETGTWTITVTLPDGQMCLVASGVNYDGTVSPAGDAT